MPKRRAGRRGGGGPIGALSAASTVLSDRFRMVRDAPPGTRQPTGSTASTRRPARASTIAMRPVPRGSRRSGGSVPGGEAECAAPTRAADSTRDPERTGTGRSAGRRRREAPLRAQHRARARPARPRCRRTRRRRSPPPRRSARSRTGGARRCRPLNPFGCRRNASSRQGDHGRRDVDAPGGPPPPLEGLEHASRAGPRLERVAGARSGELQRRVQPCPMPVAQRRRILEDAVVPVGGLLEERGRGELVCGPRPEGCAASSHRAPITPPPPTKKYARPNATPHRASTWSGSTLADAVSYGSRRTTPRVPPSNQIPAIIAR